MISELDRTDRGAAAFVGIQGEVSPTGELDPHGRELEAAVIRAALNDAGLSDSRNLPLFRPDEEE